MSQDPFSPHIEAVSKHFWGEPNARLSSGHELRWGTQGSRAADLDKGVWHDHEAGEGGGVLALVARETHCKNGEAVKYLRDELAIDIPDDRAPVKQGAPRKIVATYDYQSETGELLFQVVRFDPKDFRQRRPDPAAADGWSWSVKGVRQVPYRVGELIEAIAQDATVFIVEGEKDVDALARASLPATCNAGGAGKWPEGLAEFFRDADVVIIPDNDEPGRNHVGVVGAALEGIAKTIRVLDLPSVGPKGDVSDWLASGSAAELYLLAETTARPWNAKRPESRFGAVFWGDLERQTFTERPLVKGLVDQGDSAMFFGESGCGKSFLAVDMGMAIARGEPFLGMRTVQGPVVYQAGEGGRGLLKRLRAYKHHHHVFGDVPFVLLPDKVNLFAADGDANAFIEECAALKAYMRGLSAVFIDTFAAASAGANENASEDMGRMLDAGYRINKATGAAIFWVHHKNAQGLRERGHTSFRANIETVVEVIRDPDTKERQLHLVKKKDGEDGLRLGFELYPVEIGTDDDGDPITSCVVRPAQVGSQQAGKRAWLPNSQYTFLSCLDTAISQRGVTVPETAGVTPVTPGTMGVEFHHFRTVYSAVRGGPLDHNALRQCLHREGEALHRKGLIGRHNPYIWITDQGVTELDRRSRNANA